MVIKQLLYLALMLAAAVAGARGDPGFLANTNYFLNAEQLKSNVSSGALGNSNAAERVALHFEYAMHDEVSAGRWLAICSENGSARCQFLLYSKLKVASDLISQSRALFWLRKAAVNRDEGAMTMLELCGSLEKLVSYYDGSRPCYGPDSE